MLELERSVISVVARRLRSRAAVELENLALRHQLHVLRRQRPGRPPLFAIDRLLWVLLYRLWPRCLEVMVSIVISFIKGLIGFSYFSRYVQPGL
jgi:hypothetical protein